LYSYRSGFAAAVGGKQFAALYLITRAILASDIPVKLWPLWFTIKAV
jgi:hypothetical protein